MKFSEGLFEFPVRVYDSFSVTKSILKENQRIQDSKDGDDIDDILPEEADWVLGHAKIPIEEIKAWTDVFKEGSSVKEIAEKGFQETLIITKTLGNFECMWSMRKFEKEADEFVERYTKGIEDMVDKAIQLKRQENEYREKKKRKFLGF